MYSKVAIRADPIAKWPPRADRNVLSCRGDWTIAWGATPYVDEITPSNQVVFRLSFAPPIFTYRAVPILPGQITPAQLQTAMDTMYPRPVGGG